MFSPSGTFWISETLKIYCGDGWGWGWNAMGMGGDGNETLWGRVGMELKTMGTGGDGCNFCPRAHLYYVLRTAVLLRPEDGRAATSWGRSCRYFLRTAVPLCPEDDRAAMSWWWQCRYVLRNAVPLFPFFHSSNISFFDPQGRIIWNLAWSAPPCQTSTLSVQKCGITAPNRQNLQFCHNLSICANCLRGFKKFLAFKREIKR